jgi:hypothetical protein
VVIDAVRTHSNAYGLDQFEHSLDMEKGTGTGDHTHAQGTMSLDPPLDLSLVPYHTGLHRFYMGTPRIHVMQAPGFTSLVQPV